MTVQKKRFKVMGLGRIVAMSVITAFAIFVMVAINLKGRSLEQLVDGKSGDLNRPWVSIQPLSAEPLEIKQKYSGIIRPFERFQLAFKASGRVEQLGENQQGLPLDVGDLVQKGQELARLDATVLYARMVELAALTRFAEEEFRRAEELSQEQGAISESEFSRKKSELEVAKAHEHTLKMQIKETVLTSTVDGVVSKRRVKPGESVLAGEAVFEIIQTDKVKLVLGVPESKIHRMIGRDLKRNPLKAYVSLIRSGDFSQKPTPMLGSVCRVGETSDDQSGLFEVEVLLKNEGNLRPGMIAIAEVVIGNLTGFKVPLDAVFIRDDETFVFLFSEVVDNPAGLDGDELPRLDGETYGKAAKLVLPPGSYEFQGDFLLTSAFPSETPCIIVAGHRRLVDGAGIRYRDQ